ncbi:MAG: hypothetical protein AAF604_10690 [Acidobacteriota bacterium]
MGSTNVALWLFLATGAVATFTFITIVSWAENRRKERQEYYRFEFRKRLVESGKMDAAGVTSLMQYEHKLKLQQAREKLLVAAFVLIGVGIGICLGLQFVSGGAWRLGLIPGSIGACMLLYGAVFASKVDPGPPPPGWSSDTLEQD